MKEARTNTLSINPELCNLCGMCIDICPQRVFDREDHSVIVARPEDCMECGACMLNCQQGALTVDSGVGCASAMINAALTGGEPTCDCGCDDSCCE